MAADNTSSEAQQSRVGALESLMSELNEVAEDDLVHINVDVVAAVTTALGILPKLEKLKDSVQKLPNFDTAMVEKFETYAMGLYEAHADYLSASRPAESLPALVERGTALRDRLYADVQALIVRGLASADEIREVRTSNGYKALAVDLTLLADAVQRRWQSLQGKTAIQLEEVLEAEQLATSLLRAIGEKEQAPAVVADASARRARAFTLFVRAYDQVRRAVTYLRWEDDDADLIAPSLYRGRGAAKPKADGDVAPAPSADKTAPATPSVATTPATTKPSSSSAQNVPVGHPNSDPFTTSA